MIRLFKVSMNTDVTEELGRVLESGYVGQGPASDLFERKLKEHFNNDYLAIVNSGTSALHLAVRAAKDTLKLDSSAEVLCTALSCFATAVPILANDLRIKWCDVDLNTCNIDLTDVRRKLTANTQILMIVHWGGYPCDLDEIKQIKRDYYLMFGKSLIVIEDCAHCWNSYYKNTIIGNSGNYCAFSTQAIKFLTTIDGGFLISPNVYTDKKIKLLRWFGLDRDAGASFRCVQDIEEYGYKFQPNDVLSTIGLYNYDNANDNAETHKNNAKIYNSTLANVDGITLLENRDDVESSYWLYTIKVERRDDFMRALKDAGIESSQVHKRMDQHTCVKDFQCYLPNMDKLEKEMVCIPVGWWLSQEDIDKVISTIKTGW